MNKIMYSGVLHAVLDKVFQNMSKNGGTMLREDLECMRAVPEKSVEECRARIISIIDHLANTGEIVIAR